MRNRTLVVALLMIAAGVSARAQSADGDMTAWAAASAAEKSGIVDEILSGASGPGHASRSELLDCLDQTSHVSGHQHLPISEVAEACLHPAGPGDRAQGETEAGRARMSEGDPGPANTGSAWSTAWNG